MRYALAPQGVFATVQGEGSMSGLPTVFVRFAFCDVQCPQCDTDYKFSRHVELGELVTEVVTAAGEHSRWVWLTGGEPLMRRGVGELVHALRGRGMRIALATAGHRDTDLSGWSVREGSYYSGVDCLSVSPHGKPADLKLTGGTQINLVPGLNGLDLKDWDNFVPARFGFAYVTPMSRLSVPACVEFIRRNRGWRLGCQAHKVWGVA